MSRSFVLIVIPLAHQGERWRENLSLYPVNTRFKPLIRNIKFYPCKKIGVEKKKAIGAFETLSEMMKKWVKSQDTNDDKTLQD